MRICCICINFPFTCSDIAEAGIPVIVEIFQQRGITGFYTGIFQIHSLTFTDIKIETSGDNTVGGKNQRGDFAARVFIKLLVSGRFAHTAENKFIDIDIYGLPAGTAFAVVHIAVKCGQKFCRRNNKRFEIFSVSRQIKPVIRIERRIFKCSAKSTEHAIFNICISAAFNRIPSNCEYPEKYFKPCE